MKGLSKRSIWMGVALLVMAAVLGLYLWQRGSMGPAPVITMPGVTDFRFAGTTYGTNHVMGTSLSRLVTRLPAPLASLARSLLGSHISQMQSHSSSDPSLCVWFELLGTNAPVVTNRFVRAFLADENGVMAGNAEDFWPSFGQQWENPEFKVLPRRSRELQCVFYEFMMFSGDYREIGRVRFPNPMFGKFPQWQPEPLPAVHMAGDLEVTLASLVTECSSGIQYVSNGKGGHVLRASPAKPGGELHVAFQLMFNSPRGTKEYWTLNNAELSDATGNCPRASGGSRSEEVSFGRFTITPALWPDEAAWRLKVELKRRSCFAPGERISFTNVPLPAVGETNHPLLTNTSAIVPVTLAQIIRRPDITNDFFNSDNLRAIVSWISIGQPDITIDSYNRSRASVICMQHPTLPEGWVMDVVRMSTGTGEKVETMGNGWSSSGYEVFVEGFPTNAVTVNIEFALQQTRTVEFLAKPELAKEEVAGGGSQ